MDCDNEKTQDNESQNASEKLLLQQQMLQMQNHLKEMQQQVLLQQQQHQEQIKLQQQQQQQQKDKTDQKGSSSTKEDKFLLMKKYKWEDTKELIGEDRAGEHVRRQRMHRRHMNNVTIFISMIANKTTCSTKERIILSWNIRCFNLLL